jgi:Na+-translocating ferredoxin:NAD+ oxidoreductase subunit D
MDYFDKVKVTTSPHIRSKESISKVMTDVIIALVPTALVGIYFFGLYSLLVILTCMVSAVVVEAITQKLLKRKVTVLDMSAALTGLLLGLNLPPTVPLWIPAIGAGFAIVIVKQIFGGLGQNFMNPALGARAFLVASWPSLMLAWGNPNSTLSASLALPDAVSGATPMGLLKAGEAMPGYLDMAIGNIPGTIGEVSAIALIIGGIYLIIRKVISWHIPVAYIITVAVISFLLGSNSFDLISVGYQVLGGGLLLGAIYMATDYSSCPVSKKGQLLFGFGCGLLTAVFRLFGASAEGVSYAILIMNLAVPLIDRVIKPRLYGEVKSK